MPGRSRLRQSAGPAPRAMAAARSKAAAHHAPPLEPCGCLVLLEFDEPRRARLDERDLYAALLDLGVRPRRVPRRDARRVCRCARRLRRRSADAAASADARGAPPQRAAPQQRRGVRAARRRTGLRLVLLRHRHGCARCGGARAATLAHACVHETDAPLRSPRPRSRGRRRGGAAPRAAAHAPRRQGAWHPPPPSSNAWTLLASLSSLSRADFGARAPPAVARVRRRRHGGALRGASPRRDAAAGRRHALGFAAAATGAAAVAASAAAIAAGARCAAVAARGRGGVGQRLASAAASAAAGGDALVPAHVSCGGAGRGCCAA